jgi:hypothetical protein
MSRARVKARTRDGIGFEILLWLLVGLRLELCIVNVALGCGLELGFGLRLGLRPGLGLRLSLVLGWG